MDKQWIEKLSDDIEARHGKEARDRVFGDIEKIEDNYNFLSTWFDNFITGMDELNDKEFLRQMMVNHCPCGGNDEENGKAIKELYHSSKSLEEFVDSFREWMHKTYGDYVDSMELHDTVLYMIKPLGDHETTGSCGKGCHCLLAKNTEKIISDIFCYCCTIGHTGKMFKIAFGDKIKMEFIESIICGGEKCTMTVHLPKKETRND